MESTRGGFILLLDKAKDDLEECFLQEWFVYIIETKNGLLYTGVTKDLERRFKEHVSSKKGAKFFKRSPPVRICYSVGNLDRSFALKLEYAIKKLKRNEKIKLIESTDGAALMNLITNL